MSTIAKYFDNYTLIYYLKIEIIGIYIFFNKFIYYLINAPIIFIKFFIVLKLNVYHICVIITVDCNYLILHALMFKSSKHPFFQIISTCYEYY